LLRAEPGILEEMERWLPQAPLDGDGDPQEAGRSSASL
jgi:hypothetical protein